MDDFASIFGCPENVLTKELVLAWAKKRPHEKNATQIKRVNAVKCLAEFMKERGYEAYIYPYSHSTDPIPYMPYIFTESEMGKLLILADNYQSTPVSPHLSLTVPLVFRILYGCGLRISEVLNLRVNDTDVCRKIFMISGGKFGKSRAVPMAASLAIRCSDYLQLVDSDRRTCGGDGFLIQNPRGGRYSECTVYTWFRTLLMRAGIPHGGKGKGPRLHDIRHSYAVHCLKRWVNESRNIHALLPMLSAYMGHCDLRGTQIYLRLTPDLFPTISTTMSEYFTESRTGVRL